MAKVDNVTPFPAPDSTSRRAQVAAEVRGHLARRKIPAYKLSEYLADDSSRGYWQRRVSGDLPFNVDDLDRLASLLGVDVVEFFRGTSPSPVTPAAGTKKGPGVESQALSLPDLDSNQEPTG